jgi:hypothetical protein
VATAPTLIASSSSGIVVDPTSASYTWLAGDVFVVIALTPDNGDTAATPAATGLTFSAVTGSPTNSGSSTKGYAWSATAASGGSGTIFVDGSGSGGGKLEVLIYQYRGSDGIGNVALDAALGSTTTKSLTRGSDNSAVVQGWGDWNAVNDTTVTWTPSGQTQDAATRDAVAFTTFGAHWGDQGAAGATSYGFSGFAGGKMTAITVEVKGAAGGGGAAWGPLLGLANNRLVVTEL